MEARRVWRLWALVPAGAVLSLGFGASASASVPARSALVQLAGNGSCVAQNTDLKNCTQAKALIGASDVAVSPDGGNVYVASSGDDLDQNGSGVSAFARDQSSGRLKGIGCVTISGTNGVDTTNGQCADGDALAGLTSITVSPDGRNVYATARTSDAIDVFRRDPASGALTQLACIRHSADPGSHCVIDFPLQGPTDVVVSPDGNFVYVGTSGNRHTGVMTYARDPATGMLRSHSCVSADGNDGICATAPALDGVEGLAFSPDGASLYAAVSRSGSGALVTFRRDTATGALAEADCLVAIAPTGSVCRDAGITLSDVSNGFAGGGASSVVLSPTGGNVYVAAPGIGSILGFDRSAPTGLPTLDGCIKALPPPEEPDTGNEPDSTDEQAALSCAEAPGLEGVSELAMSRDGQTVYGTSFSSDTVVSLARKPGGHLAAGACITDTSDLEDGGQACSPATALSEPLGIAISPDGANVYVAARGSNAVTVFGPSLGISSARARLHGRRFTVTLSCPASMPHACSGDLRVTLPRTRRAAVRAKIASHRGYALRQGTTGRFRLAVSRRLARRVEKKRAIALIIEASQHAGDRRPTARLVTVRG